MNGKEEEEEPPFIDFSLLNSSSPQELDKFNSALSSWGCFQLTNHGIPKKVLDEIREMSRQFFRLPMEEKMRYAMVGGELNGFEGHNSYSDWNQALNLTVFPQHTRQLQFWPLNPIQFREVIQEYTMKLTDILEVIFKMVICSLKVDENKFREKYGKNKGISTRINFYPECPNPKDVLGLKAHADFSAITIVLQDVIGLQVLKDGQWFTIPALPQALFVNIGDPIEIMSNGIYKSAVHRVVTNREKSRVSIALFYDSDRDCEIGPLDELISDDHPQLYKRVSLKDYVANFFESYKSGERAINSLRI